MGENHWREGNRDVAEETVEPGASGPLLPALRPVRAGSGFEEALEQILTRCTLHTHRSKVWAPGHRRPLIETARRHAVLVDRLAARDGEGLARALGEHIDTIVSPQAGKHS